MADPEPRSTEAITYRYIDEACGGTFHFEHRCEQETYSCIGTAKLFTCVAVYFPISDTKCFFAHIGASVKLHPGVHALPGLDVEEERGESIRSKVLNRLKEHAKTHDWAPEDVIDYCDQKQRKAIVMCCKYTDSPKRPGPYVIQAIKEFLGESASSILHEKYNSLKEYGFVVDHSSGDVHMVPRGPEERFKFARSMEYMAEKDWSFHGDTEAT